jgi:AIG2-like family
VTLHFAYGSNMSRTLMRSRCRDARPLGIATLPGWRFVINREGFGSIAPAAGGLVLGVLWRLSTRDIVAINAYESISTGLYVRRRIAVRMDGKQAPALVYITRRGGKGRPRPSYIDLVVQAARDWELPEHYIRSLARWSPSGWRGVRVPDTGEVG